MWRQRVLLVVLGFGCGPTRLERAAPRDEDGSAGSGGATSSGAAGGASPGGLGGGGSAGRPAVVPPIPPPEPPEPQPPGPHPAFECAGSAPRPTLGGYRDCADGTMRRPVPAECVSHLPFVPTSDTLVGNECRVDTDCEGPHDYCEWGLCQQGCVSDDECQVGQVCLCEEPVGRCVAASCASDADCPPDYPCTGAVLADGVSFACQHPEDECLTDSDCGRLGANRCVLEVPRKCILTPG